VAPSPARRLLAAGIGALASRQALTLVATSVHPAKLARTNFRGRQVTLAGGPALALGATVGAALGAGSPRLRAAALVAGLGAGAVGGYDDQVGMRPEQKAKGFRGHLTALAEGRVTSGLIKIVGVGASGLAAAALLADDRSAAVADDRSAAVADDRSAADRPAAGRSARAGRRGPRVSAARSTARRGPGAPTSRAGWRPWVDVVLAGGVIAGTANLFNLLDLRPGRAIKAGLLVSAPLVVGGGTGSGVAAGAAGAAAGLLPADLDEEIMLGDAGANALGALLGTALAARTGTAGRAALLAGIAALTAASEKVSFTQVIGRTPVLRELDALGRRAA
jgi:UDP-N-acetylmuramyl pentapeptide phosphotransferase/UDP-N-acetylglucosamine-1-phosphate transferase